MALKNIKMITDKCSDHEQHLIKKHGKRFFQALEESESKKMVIHFTHSVNLAQPDAVVTTRMAFKDKEEESGMDVVKTFHADVTSVLDSPDAPRLPGMDKTKAPAAGEGEEKD